MSQSDTIISAINALQHDPACGAITSLLEKVQQSSAIYGLPQGQQGAAASRLEVLPQELDEILNYTQRFNDPLAQKAIPVVTGLMEEGAMLPISNPDLTRPDSGASDFTRLKNRTAYAADYGISLADGLMDAIPQSQQCMNNNPDTILTLFGAAVHMAGTLAANGAGLSGKLGNTIGNMTRFLRNEKYAKILLKVNQSKYWANVSCLMETTAQNYCSAAEAFQLLSYQQQLHENGGQPTGGMSDPNNPMNGYYLMVRELPTISDWLQKVQFGVSPRLQTDADFKNGTLDAMNNLLKQINSLKGTYQEAVLQYQTLPDAKSKKNFLMSLITDLNGHLTGFVMTGGDGSTSAANKNFFTTSLIPQLIPFYMIGMDQIPPECAANDKGQFQMNWNDWMVGNGEYKPQFNNPDELLRTIGLRLDMLSDQAMNNGSAYFRQRMVVDNQDLVSQTVANQTVNVVESMQHVKDYLRGLLDRAKKDPERGMVIAPSLVDTIHRIDRVLDSYNKVKSTTDSILEAYRLFADLGPCPYSDKDKTKVKMIVDLLNKIDPTQDASDVSPNSFNDELKQRVNRAYVAVIGKAYDEFNVMLQRDSFFNTRVSTFVKWDYADRIHRQENMTPYQRQILVTSGKSLLDQLMQIQQVNPAPVRLDLAQAQVQNKANLQSVEDLVSDSLFDAINHLNRTQAGGYTAPPPFSFSHPVSSFVDSMTDFDVPWKHRPYHDDDHAAEQLRSKLCIQTLAFENWEKFLPICQGSILKSGTQTSDSSLKLDLSYDEMIHRKASKEGKKDTPFVCALRNYMQQNQVYWLTTRLGSSDH